MAARVPAEASFSSSSLALGWESSFFAMIEVLPRRWDLNPWATWDVWPLPLSPAEVVGDLEVPVMPPIAFIQAELGTWSSRYGGFEVLLLILSLVRGELRTSSYGPRRMPTPVLSPRAGGNMFPPSSVHGVKHEVTSTLGPSEDHTMDFRFFMAVSSFASWGHWRDCLCQPSTSVPTGWRPWSSSPERDTEAISRPG